MDTNIHLYFFNVIMKKTKNKNISTLRERFIIDFCKKKGWNHNELTTGQMLIISNNTDYKNPKL